MIVTTVDRAVAPRWHAVRKADPRLVALADRHYTRQSRGARQCCRPGHNLTLLLSDGAAGWIVWRPIPEVGRMDGLEAWECTLFRNESHQRSSALIRAATRLTFRAWGWPPKDGLVTAVDVRATARRRGRNNPPGACYVAAGWTPIGLRRGRAWLRAPHPRRRLRSLQPNVRPPRGSQRGGEPTGQPRTEPTTTG